MNEWKPKLKFYPHFDKPLSEEKIFDIVLSPERVTQNSFYPFLLYNKVTGRFGRESKSRPIRYAARRDAYIYSYYRHLLSERYEEKLKELGIENCPIAYRALVIEKTHRGKCNIHFAKEAVEQIKKYGNCYAIALDISSYFESLDHSKIEKIWNELLGTSSLPPDHKAVFKAVTNYTIVDLYQCYEVLGYYGDVDFDGITKKGYKLDPRAIPMQLCTPTDFRKKICGGSSLYPKLTVRHKDDKGIPQGSPISDIIANFYLLDFDRKMSELASICSGYYRRYCDDILFICPIKEGILDIVMQTANNEIKLAGASLEIKASKSNVTKFQKLGDELTIETILPAGKMKPFEYLGFAFDGKVVKLKDQTVSRYYRKITFGVRGYARELVKRYPTKTDKQILALADVSMLFQKYTKIEEFENSSGYTEWNFWTYAKRAAKIISPIENIILQQLAGNRRKILTLLGSEIRVQKATVS